MDPTGRRAMTSLSTESDEKKMSLRFRWFKVNLTTTTFFTTDRKESVLSSGCCALENYTYML